MHTLSHLPSEFQEALPILEKLQAAGFEAYFVGGSVRDVLLERPIHDVDIATSAYPQETKSVFPRTVDVGIEHGTVLVLDGEREYEVTTFRTEDVYVDYRRPSAVTFVRSLKEDLKRRDFTVNALALNEQSEIIDLFDGMTDLQQKVLRAVGVADERFKEDALRIMRGFRFAASLDFAIASDTFTAMKAHAPLLEKISVERSFIELDKLLLAPQWRKGLRALLDCQSQNYLPHLAIYCDSLHTLMERLAADFRFSASEQAWASLFIWQSEVPDVRQFLKDWKTSNEFQKKVSAIVSAFRLRQGASLSAWDLYAFGTETLLLVEDLRKGLGLPTDYDRIYALEAGLVIHSKKDMCLNGRDLMETYGLAAGPHLGHILDDLEKAMVMGRLANDQKAVSRYLKEKGVV
ncbi:CCA tRNA nucleotidyltransferase [Streptococcus sp. DD12]|uniref:CCA tRNA nucleotidyltransferase n=1 Tax=Streptococcus sp. DD12 TaxID=1777880 RepID=UPI0007933352|nr:CCA tRNA nucleotidyltransferase [Streptococcus sp. DD12]KXT76481.1 tRNA nucleotidyltransferase [Streptococcus sp. DD12]